MPLKSPFHSGPIPDCSFATYLFTSPTHPQDNTKPIFVDAEDTRNFLTMYTYRLYAQRLAAGLRKQGFKSGDRLLLYSGNNIYFPVIILGAIMAGGIFTGANPTYVAREVVYQLQDSEATFFLMAPGSSAVGLEAVKEAGLDKSRVFMFDSHSKGNTPQDGFEHWSTLLASEDEGKAYSWDPCTRPGECNRTIALNYSSGTTGRPKGVEITHRNYVSNCLGVETTMERRRGFRPSDPQEVWLAFLPMYHAMAQTFFSAFVPRAEITLYIMPRFDFIKMLDAIQRFRVTYLLAVPPIIVAMAKHPDVRSGKWDLSSLKQVLAGAAPLGKEACKEFEAVWAKHFNHPDEVPCIRQGWGMTEGTCTLTSHDLSKVIPSNSVGQPSPNITLRFMNEDGSAEVPDGERGEIWIQGPTVMKGYWRNETATNETLTPDGWLKTGDIGYVDKEGLIYIVDRRKELIKVKGNQVAPAELEALLLDHPAVADAAVIGVPHGEDEAPRAYVVLNVGQSAAADDIAAFVEKRVSRHKRLQGGVRFIDSIPKNPSGKILRKFLREQAAKEREGPRARL